VTPEEFERLRQLQNMTKQSTLMDSMGMTGDPRNVAMQAVMTPSVPQFEQARQQVLDSTSVPQRPPEPGLLSRLGGRVMDNLRDPARRAEIAASLNAMSINASPALQQQLMSRSRDIRGRRQLAQTGNATVNFLRSQGQEDLAKLIEDQPAMAGSVMQAVLRDPKQATAMLQGYAMFKAENPTATFKEYLDLTNRGSSTTIQMGAQPSKSLTTRLDSYIDAGTNALNANQALDFVMSVGTGMQTGPFEARKAGVRQFFASIGVNVDEKQLGDAQTLEAYTNSLVADELRKNKGPQTDFDAQFSKTFLPSLGDTTEAFKRKLDYLRSRNLRDILIGGFVSDKNTYQQNVETDIATATEAGKLSRSVPSVTFKDGQYITLAQFYDASRSEGLSDNDILAEWVEVTKGDIK